jgi:hypothetical protein
MKKIKWPTDPVWEFNQDKDFDRFFDAILVLTELDVKCYLEIEDKNIKFSEKFEVKEDSDLSFWEFKPIGKYYKLSKEFILELKEEIHNIGFINHFIVYNDQVLLDACDVPFDPFQVSRIVTDIHLKRMSELLNIEPKLVTDVFGD